MFTPTILDELRHFSYTKLTKDIIYLDPSPELKAIGDLIAGNSRYWTNEFSIFEIPQSSRFFKSLTQRQHETIANNIQVLDELKKKHFDLIIFESIFTCALPLMDYLNIKAFALAQSFQFESSNMRLLGESVMPSHVPDFLAQYSDQMTLYERFLNTLQQLLLHNYNFSPDYYISYDNPNKKIWPQIELPKTSYVFTNSNPYLDFPRSIIAKNIPIGGITVNLQTLRSGKLTDEWDQILNLRNKTILVAFGSVLLSKDMPFDYKVSLARAMKQFPDVTFLWKYEDSDTDHFAKGIDNIVFTKWVPQREILADPRLSAFMTHGGIGSINEVSYLGKPSIMCPVMGDQMRTAKMLARHNGAIEISKYELSNSKVVEEAFRNILYDDSYTIAAKRLSEMLEFQPTKPKDLFLKHAEFAARFGKLPSLDPYSRQMGFIQYFLIDIGFIVLSLAILICLSVYFTFKIVFRSSWSKPKTE